MNKVIIKGRLTKDVELKSTQNGKNVTSFAVAVNRRYAKQGEERQADFINCVAWDKTADFISKYFKKGSEILLTGRMDTRQYDDKEGKRVYVTEVVAEEVEFCGSNNQSSTQNDDENLPF